MSWSSSYTKLNYENEKYQKSKKSFINKNSLYKDVVFKNRCPDHNFQSNRSLSTPYWRGNVNPTSSPWKVRTRFHKYRRLKFNERFLFLKKEHTKNQYYYPWWVIVCVCVFTTVNLGWKFSFVIRKIEYG